MRTLARLFVAFLVFVVTPPKARAALVYVPKDFRAPSARIVVVVHGCLQSAESMALGSGWDRLADRENLLIVYPQVDPASHELNCWSWFDRRNQEAESGQLRSIMNDIRDAQRRYGLARAPVYAAGISSGAATIAGLLACYPRMFTAGAMHSGPPYGRATTEDEGKLLLLNAPVPGSLVRAPCDPRAFRGRLLVLQGASDSVVNPRNARAAIVDFFGTLPEFSRRSEANGATFEEVSFGEGVPRAKLIMVEGLDHAWSGYNLNLSLAHLVGPGRAFPTHVPFFAPKGPSATDAIWDFFRASVGRSN